MSLKSRLKKKVKSLANKLPQVKVFKAAKSMFSGGKEESGDESGLRSAAAKRLINTQQQAGSGQIKFTTEEDVV